MAIRCDETSSMDYWDCIDMFDLSLLNPDNATKTIVGRSVDSSLSPLQPPSSSLSSLQCCNESTHCCGDDGDAIDIQRDHCCTSFRRNNILEQLKRYTDKQILEMYDKLIKTYKVSKSSKRPKSIRANYIYTRLSLCATTSREDWLHSLRR